MKSYFIEHLHMFEFENPTIKWHKSSDYIVLNIFPISSFRHNIYFLICAYPTTPAYTDQYSQIPWFMLASCKEVFPCRFPFPHVNSICPCSCWQVKQVHLLQEEDSLSSANAPLISTSDSKPLKRCRREEQASSSPSDTLHHLLVC